MKYRIVRAFPGGYKIQEKEWCEEWEDTQLYNTEEHKEYPGKPHIFKDLVSAGSILYRLRRNNNPINKHKDLKILKMTLKELREFSKTMDITNMRN